MAFVPPHRVPRLAIEAGLAREGAYTYHSARYTLETRTRQCIKSGMSLLSPLAIGKPMPKAGVFAHRQAEVVAHNIAVAITGKGEAGRFEGHGECFVGMRKRASWSCPVGAFYAEPAPQREDVYVPAPRRTLRRCCSRRTGYGVRSCR